MERRKPFGWKGWLLTGITFVFLLVATVFTVFQLNSLDWEVGNLHDYLLVYIIASGLVGLFEIVTSVVMFKDFQYVFDNAWAAQASLAWESAMIMAVGNLFLLILYLLF